MDNTNVPLPEPQESFDRYSIRAQRALFGTVPDAFDRLKLIRSTWRDHRGPTPEEALADRKFSPDRYRKVEDVCVFSEHDTTDSQGKPRKYRLRELAKLVRYNNERALEKDAFAAIADRHTTNPGDPNPSEPRVIGYAGPYRLGLIGRRKPTWAIFADEYRFPDEDATFRDRNRRSVELWTDKARGVMWFDPITTCGAEAPRLALPAQYSQHQVHGVTLERYTAGAVGFVAPGNANTHVRGFRANNSTVTGTAIPREPSITKQPSKYAADEAQTTPGGEPMETLSPEALKQIVDAILDTPQMQWVSDQMQNQAPAPGDAGLPPASSAPPGLPPEGQPVPGGAPGGDPNAMPTEDELADLDDLLGGEEPPPGGPAGGPPLPEEPEERNTMAPYTQRGLPERYAALQASQDRLVREHGRTLEENKKLAGRLTALEHRAKDAERLATIERFTAEHAQFPFDREKLLTKALYSKGGQLSDEQFAEKIEELTQYAQAFVPQMTLPGGEIEREGTDRERYEARLGREAIRIHTQARDRGVEMTWDEAKTEAAKAVK